MNEENRRVQIDEIASKLSVPRHFLGKIMQQVVKAGLLKSTKGPYGGFAITDRTLSTPLTSLLEITSDLEQFHVCILKLKACDAANPCPLHHEVDTIKKDLLGVFEKTTVNDLLTDNKSNFIRSLSI